MPTCKTLVVIAGPTAAGKTDIAIKLAKHWGTEIISCDSRQFYKELNIGTAKPSVAQLTEVKHHFIGHLSIHDYYNVSRFEQDTLKLLEQLFSKKQIVIMVGGSGLYIDAVCNGIDDLPDPTPEIRSFLKGKLQDEGIGALQQLLQQLDPDYFQTVDLQNPARLVRALEVCMVSGKAYSAQRNNPRRTRDFEIVKIGLQLPRQQLFERISLRTDQMMQQGLLSEVQSLLAFRHLNALNTVGYKELFNFLDNKISLEQAVTDIKTHTRRYAKRQFTWFNRNNDYKWFEPEQLQEIIAFVEEC